MQSLSSALPDSLNDSVGKALYIVHNSEWIEHARAEQPITTASYRTFAAARRTESGHFVQRLTSLDFQLSYHRIAMAAVDCLSVAPH